MLDQKLIESKMASQVEVTYENSKGEIKCILASKKQLLVWCQIANKEITICLQYLRELSYSFGLYFLVLFFVFLD